MARLNEITSFVNTYLKKDDIEDACWNGLQIEGKPEVKKIAFAVDPSIITFKKAAEINADLLITHHALFWKGDNPAITGILKERIETLTKDNISLYSAHLPLDRHEIVGNNAQLLKIIGAEITKEFSIGKDNKNVGWIGTIKSKKPLEEIESTLNKELNTTCKTLDFGKKDVGTVAVCSGGGEWNDFFEAIENKVDLYITGEAKDIYHYAKDHKINVIFAGHYASEIVGVKALSKVIKEKFNIETEFIDIPTGL